MKLVINGYVLDVIGTPSVTYNIGLPIDNFTKYAVSHTSAIKVAKTNAAIRAFTALYSQKRNLSGIHASLLNDRGIVLLSGVAFMKNEGTNYFSLYLYENALALIDQLKATPLSSLGFSGLTSWNAAAWESRRNATSGVVAPAINYSQLDTMDATPNIGGYDGLNKYFPSVYVKSVLAQIQTDLDFTLDVSAIESFDEYDKLVIAYSINNYDLGTSFNLASALPTNISAWDVVELLLLIFNARFVPTGPNIFKIVPLNDTLKSLNNWSWLAVFNETDYTNEYAKRNTIMWAEDPTWDIIYPNPDINYPTMLLNPKGVEASKQLYQSKFAKFGYNECLIEGGTTGDGRNLFYSPNFIGYEITTPTIDIVYTGNWWNPPIPNICTLKAKGGSDTNIIYNGTSYSDYLKGTDELLRWDSIQTKFYSEVTRLIGDYTVKQFDCALSVFDLQGILQNNVMFIKDETFLISKITNFVEGQRCKVDAIKLS